MCALHYIFASFFFKCKREQLSNWEKYFFFHFKSSFRSQENQILEFYIFQISWRLKCLSIKKKCILLNNLGSNYSLLIKFCQFISYYKRKSFVEKFYKNCGLKTSSRSFCVCKELSTTSIGKWNFCSKLLI